MDDSADPAARQPWPWVALVAGLLALTLTRVYDLDHGFVVATGRAVIAHGGIPENEVLLPLLADRPFTSQWVLAALVFLAAWEALGVAGLVLLKAIGYGGGFFLAARAAARRGTPGWLACLLAVACAAFVSVRFVERPGLFSVLGLGVLHWWLAGPRAIFPKNSLPFLAALFTLWSWCHAEWWLGVGLLGAWVLGNGWSWPWRAAAMAAALAPPFLTFLLLHPSGAGPLLEPFRVIGGRAADFAIKEYSSETWRSMPLALLMPAGALATAGWLARRRRWWEAAALVVLCLLCVKVPRTVLPLAVILVPFAGEALARVAPGQLPRRRLALVSVLVVLVGVAGVRATPWRKWGLGMDPSLDVRGVALALEDVPEAWGTVVLASYGYGSLLLSQPAVARRGVVLDGRQEAAPDAYYHEVYLPLMSTRSPQWPVIAAQHGVGLVFEPWPTGTNSLPLSRSARVAGWKLIGWDESGRLYARPDLVENSRKLQFDPADLEWVLSNPLWTELAAHEIGRHVELLSGQGLPVIRGRIALAQLETRLGRLDAALTQLDATAELGGKRYVSWWATAAELATAEGNWEAVEDYAVEVARRGRKDLGALLRAQAALQRGDEAEARAVLEAALEETTLAERGRLEGALRAIEEQR